MILTCRTDRITRDRVIRTITPDPNDSGLSAMWAVLPRTRAREVDGVGS